MKKIFLILITISFGINLIAEPADNFKAAGIGIGGKIEYNHKYDNFLSDTNNKSASTSISIEPDFHFFIIDNLALDLGLGFSYNNYMNNSNYGNSYWPGIELSGSLGVDYYLTGFGKYVPSFGVFAGLSKSASLDGTRTDGSTSEDSSTNYEYNFGLEVVNSYFLTDNLAVSLTARSNISGDIDATNTDGTQSEFEEDYNHYDVWDMNNRFFIGLTYYKPHGSEHFMFTKK